MERKVLWYFVRQNVTYNIVCDGKHTHLGKNAPSYDSTLCAENIIAWKEVPSHEIMTIYHLISLHLISLHAKLSWDYIPPPTREYGSITCNVLIIDCFFFKVVKFHTSLLLFTKLILCNRCQIIHIQVPQFLSFWSINSSPPGDSYMHQWIKSALVQRMAYRLFCAKPLSKPILGYCQLDPKEQTAVNQNTKLFIHENAHENIICKMATILPRGDKWITSFLHSKMQALSWETDSLTDILQSMILTSSEWWIPDYNMKFWLQCKLRIQLNRLQL